jgi:replicative DNA helicase
VKRLDDFRHSLDWCADEAEDRAKTARQVQPIGIDYLDDAMVGLFPDDVVLLGAGTGVGKTALATMLAEAGSVAGRRVGFLALEASQREIERRIKYRRLARAYFDDPDRMPGEVSFALWRAYRCEPQLAKYASWVEEGLRRDLANLRTYYRTDAFTPDDLRRVLLGARDLVDVFVLDHFHYIDQDSADQSELRFQAELTKLISSLARDMGRPVIVVAHLRKGSHRDERLVPGLDDFMGSSHLVKIATRAVLMAQRRDDAPQANPSKTSTLVHVAKDRVVGTTRYVGELTFDRNTSSYLPGYDLRELLNGGKELQTPTRLPGWAKRSR